MSERGRKAARAERRPSAAERALWLDTVRDARAFERRRREQEEIAQDLPAEAGAAPRPARPLAQRAETVKAPELEVGRAVSLDGRSAQRLKRGQYPISARLDLHGMTQREAHSALVSFIEDGAARGRRCVLVITGKGGEAGGRGPGAGVLRRSLPRWLNSPGLRPLVLALSEAQSRHGGAGAYYLLLRRPRPR
ncbi:MAG TPA: Smr/MutS family protein [Alphaproteobacteria bacterium]|nr:Smr/MutS family protein [Alphaproteobacteria bacterium]